MKKILAVSISLLFAVAAIAQEQRKPQTFTERYGEQLGLTGEQKKVIEDMETKFNTDHEKFLAEYRQTMMDYREARQANDQAKIDALKPKMDTQRTEMMKLRGAQEEKIEATFTNDQKAKWSKIKEERAARMKERDQHQ
jgi:Spy/CpxP family protein refolding chaperone